jgi:hypothetical protein
MEKRKEKEAQKRRMKEIKKFHSIKHLIDEIEKKIFLAKKNGIKSILIDTVDMKGIDKDALLSYFREKNQFVDYTRCRQGYFDIIIRWNEGL